MSRDKLEECNILKGISIFFVVSIHIVYKFFTADSKPFLFELYNYFTGFAVPFFMILGGFFFGKKYLNSNQVLLTREELLRSIKRIAKRIVFPYYLFVLLLTTYNFFAGKNIFWKHFMFIDSNEHGLYFLIIYTYSFIFSLMLLYFLGEKANVTAAFLIAISSFVFFFITNSIKPIHSVVLSQLPLISFFCCGIIMFFTVTKWMVRISTVTMLTILTVTMFLFTGGIVLARKILGPFPVITSTPPTCYYLVYSLLLFLYALCLTSNRSVAEFFKWFRMEGFGEKSMFIFLVHPYFIKAVVPIILNVCSHFNLTYDNNIFFIPVIITAYMVTLLSSRAFDILPQDIRRLFSR